MNSPHIQLCESMQRISIPTRTAINSISFNNSQIQFKHWWGLINRELLVFMYLGRASNKCGYMCYTIILHWCYILIQMHHQKWETVYRTNLYISIDNDWYLIEWNLDANKSWFVWIDGFLWILIEYRYNASICGVISIAIVIGLPLVCKLIIR